VLPFSLLFVPLSPLRERIHYDFLPPAKNRMFFAIFIFAASLESAAGELFQSSRQSAGERLNLMCCSPTLETLPKTLVLSLEHC
jgi:hypothetical protein